MPSAGHQVTAFYCTLHHCLKGTRAFSSHGDSCHGDQVQPILCVRAMVRDRPGTPSLVSGGMMCVFVCSVQAYRLMLVGFWWPSGSLTFSPTYLRTYTYGCLSQYHYWQCYASSMAAGDLSPNGPPGRDCWAPWPGTPHLLLGPWSWPAPGTVVALGPWFGKPIVDTLSRSFRQSPIESE